MLSWLHETPEPPRPLTLPELRRLHKLGFGRDADRIAAGTCSCGISRLSSNHVEGEDGEEPCSVWLEAQERPLEATEAPRQPWERAA